MENFRFKTQEYVTIKILMTFNVYKLQLHFNNCGCDTHTYQMDCTNYTSGNRRKNSKL